MSQNKLSPTHTVVVGCLVRNACDEVLLIRHHARGWEIPQGRVEEGENLIEALQREVLEEAGVEIKAGPLAAIWSMVSPPSALIFGFLGRYLGGALSCGGDSEESGWFAEKVALEKVTGTVMKERLRNLLDYDGSTIYRSYSIKPYLLRYEAATGR